MCQEVRVKNERIELGTCRELAAWLGIEPEALIPLDGEPWREMKGGANWRDCCLCPVDVEGTLDTHKVYHYRDGDGTIYAINRKARRNKFSSYSNKD